MKVLLATTLILFLMTSVSYSATNEMEVLESKGFHIINSPSDKGLWNTKESLEWLAIYMKPDKDVELVIPKKIPDPEARSVHVKQIEAAILSDTSGYPSLPDPPTDTITVTTCFLKHGDVVRVLGFSEDNTMVIVKAHRRISLTKLPRWGTWTRALTLT